MRGQIKKSMEYMQLKLSKLEKFAPALIAISEKIEALEKYVIAGQKETAFAKARELEAELAPPFNESIPFGYLQIYTELGDAEKAEEAVVGAEAYIQKFQFEINRPTVLNGQGRIHEIRGEFEQAIQSYEKQLELEPTKAKIHRNIGRCYRQLKDYKKAEEHLQKTLQRYPFSPKTLYELALVYADDGETEKALQHLQKAVKVWENADADYKYATQAKKKLSQLQS
ncbi:tetratricopeptide repeat protein [candidate division KSB1 bacterium]|nr:tetratricopeptide repeat protein [candidate division KSB1 bacterium]